MLGLAKQVGGHVAGVGGLVGNHQHLGGARHHVNVQVAIGHAFGLRNKCVARSHQLVHPRDKARPIGEGGHGLGAAHGDAAVHPRHPRGGQYHIAEVLGGGRDHNDLFHPRHLGGNHIHEHRAGVGGTATGDVHPHPLQGADQPPHLAPAGAVPQTKAHLHLAQQLLLIGPDVLGAALEGSQQVRGNPPRRLLQLLHGHLSGRVLVKFHGVLLHRLVAPGPHIFHDGRHTALNLHPSLGGTGAHGRQFFLFSAFSGHHQFQHIRLPFSLKCRTGWPGTAG